MRGNGKKLIKPFHSLQKKKKENVEASNPILFHPVALREFEVKVIKHNKKGKKKLGRN
jgi:hypothetical protein